MISFQRNEYELLVLVYLICWSEYVPNFISTYSEIRGTCSLHFTSKYAQYAPIQMVYYIDKLTISDMYFLHTCGFWVAMLAGREKLCSAIIPGSFNKSDQACVWLCVSYVCVLDRMHYWILWLCDSVVENIWMGDGKVFDIGLTTYRVYMGCR